jgi:hypothetical protein
MELYKTVKENLLTEIELLSRKHSLSLFDKIRKEKDLRNLEALLTEAHFGFYFDKIGTTLKYNHSVGGLLTPDFLFTMNGQEILAEVARINPVQKDMDIDDEENKMIENFRKSNPNDQVIPGIHSITWKPDRLVGQRGSIVKKAERYNNLVSRLNRPFMVCVYLAFVSGLDQLDLSHGLYGSLSELTGEYEGLGYAFDSPFRILDSALYYNSEIVRRTVSGVLLRDHDGSFIFTKIFQVRID